jgi:hypothetical protein
VLTLNTTITHAGETAKIIWFAHRGMVTPHHAKSFSCNGVTQEAFFADFDDRGGSTRIGYPLTRKDHELLEELIAFQGVELPFPRLE